MMMLVNSQQKRGTGKKSANKVSDQIQNQFQCREEDVEEKQRKILILTVNESVSR